uniref:MULE transposase domain-containing protein n=1 Tax=Triticum urartu TaxID=4572 RepID=A0A8R7TCW3_TRIUA
MAYRARKQALKVVQGDQRGQYTRIRDYLQAVLDTNLGSRCVVTTEHLPQHPSKNSTFHGLFYCLNACKEGFLNGCRPFIGVDGCFIKLSTGQQILAATGRDGNNNIYPIAFGVVDKEDTNSWTWFLTQLKDALGGESGKFGYYTIISDRQKPTRSHASASSTAAAPTRKRPSPCTADVGTAPPRKKVAPAATTPSAPPRKKAAPAASAPTAPPRRSPRKNATPAPTAPPRRSPRKKTTPAGASSTSAAGHRGTFHSPRQTGRKRTVSYKMKEYLYASGN